ncbi:unnamed protein product [Durusdinium trenchii]|uniref:Uncharacterized protein n=1 Tax=Durusdinium trenchii TaxID=1381693 RepID=A0ABP0MKA3_9DINO
MGCTHASSHASGSGQANGNPKKGQLLHTFQGRPLQKFLTDMDEVSSVGSNLDVSDLHVSSWRDDFQQESPCGLLIRKPPDRRLHQKHVRRLDRFLTEVREDPTVLLKRVSERRGSTSLEADSAGDLDVVSV